MSREHLLFHSYTQPHSERHIHLPNRCAQMRIANGFVSFLFIRRCFFPLLCENAFFIFSHFCFQLFMCALGNRFPYSILACVFEFLTASKTYSTAYFVVLCTFCLSPLPRRQHWLVLSLLCRRYPVRFFPFHVLIYGASFFPLLTFIIHSSFNFENLPANVAKTYMTVFCSKHRAHTQRTTLSKT